MRHHSERREKPRSGSASGVSGVAVDFQQSPLAPIGAHGESPTREDDTGEERTCPRFGPPVLCLFGDSEFDGETGPTEPPVSPSLIGYDERSRQLLIEEVW